MTKKLREGFTTGTAAAAAAKAAVLALLRGAVPERVSIALPPFLLENDVLGQEGKERLSVPVAGGAREPDDTAWARVIKDGGDDPDATHGASILVRASFSPFAAGPGRVFSLSLPGGVMLHTGPGVGVATLPGLPIAVGEPAINPQPRRQIAFAVAEAASFAARVTGGSGASDQPDTPGPDATAPGSLHLLLEVPDGTVRARRTLNPRLGIVGGISILGNRGTVRPYSHDAWQATISQGIAIAGALGLPELLFSTGRRSERLGFSRFPHLPSQAGIQAADHAAYALREAAKGRFARLRWVCFPGKLLKLAQGLEWTHARSGPADIELLAALTRQVGGGKATAARVAAMPTATGAFGVLAHGAPLHDIVLQRLGDKAYAALSDWLEAACAQNDTPVPGLSLHVFSLEAENGTTNRPLMEWGETSPPSPSGAVGGTQQP